MSVFEDREAIEIINEGKKIFAILHLPKNATNPPLVVICPGFAGSKIGKHRVFVSIAEALTKKGVAVLRFDYRGSGDSEGSFSELTIDSQVSDVIEVVEFIKRGKYSLDASRIGLLGRSLGGMIATLAASKLENIKCMTLWAPVFSASCWKPLFNALLSNQSKESALLTNLPKSIPAIPSRDFLAQFFKINLVPVVKSLEKIPLLHIHGIKDEFVKYSQAADWQKACTNFCQKKFVALENSDHDFSVADERLIAVSHTVDWLTSNLL